MNELIRVATNEQGSQVVSARELHSFLESKQQFADWIKNRIDKYGFVEDQDFTTFSEIYEKGRPRINYALTLDMAKELAMVEANEKGQQARRYFIECEKQYRQVAPKPLTPAEQLLQQAQLMVEQERRVTALESKVQEIEARTTTRPDYFTIAGYANVNRIPVNLKVAARAGQQATKLCKERGYLLDACDDPRFGRVNMYPRTVLDEVFRTPLQL
ncbi:phage antirepressor protein [Fibrisoma montanum]|uniref:Phage antirepressor protein n=1 Tax=Fibrisoma montanum TaxID=2305895 RepID=A0A418M3J2_9BACT|nr:antA/AntB antirepressor family protein [Fibrisoma montanum]RIV20320.1 phage antirepressor protein [Fibrisoma montanum]